MGRFEAFFEAIAAELDLTETEERTIKGSYDAVGSFLADSDSLKLYKPHVFPQGSARLGTVVKPLAKDDYDIDLVCELSNAQGLSASAVKRIVGDALQKGRYSEQLEDEHGRCWTLSYSANPPYHLDILPGVGIKNGRIKATIKRADGSYDWLFTNPKGFAEWFLGLCQRTRSIKDSFSVEPVRVEIKKSPLQRAVQLIKRHRDVHFKKNPKLGPASVIITTLSGLCFSGENTIEDILRSGPIQWMSKIVRKDGKYHIRVPSLPDDDYADKWNGEDPDAPKRFFEWYAKLVRDLDRLFSQKSANGFLTVAKEMFEASPIDKVAHSKRHIMDSLQESFVNDRRLPAKENSLHPLFQHAKSISSERYLWVPKHNIKIRIWGGVYPSYDLAFSDKGRIEVFDSASPLLLKGMGLRFTAAIDNPGQIKWSVLWQITNTGSEAAGVKDGLRGGFVPCDKDFKRTRLEGVAYRGTHFVQAFLVDDSSRCCVAESNILVINIGGGQ